MAITNQEIGKLQRFLVRNDHHDLSGQVAHETQIDPHGVIIWFAALAICFWVLQGALFLWAAGEKLGLAPALSTWDCLTVLMVFYLAVSAVIGFRRGFA